MNSRKCLFLLLVVAVIVFFFTVILRDSRDAGKAVFETRNEDTASDNMRDQISGLQSAVKSLSSMMESALNTPKDRFGVNNTAFHIVLKQRASWNKTIVLSSVDSGYVDMAINLYFTSFKKLNIENYLFVGSDSEVCGALSVFNIACFDYIHDKDGKTSSGYFSQAFKRKTHLKTKIILEALGLGFSVLIADVDIVFLKDPLPLLNCDNCDIEISSDVVEGNSGFYISRPTAAAITLHNNAWMQGLAKPQVSNQKAIDRLMEKMQKRKEIKVKNLDPKVFANGKVYFEDGKRMFKGDNPCAGCVIVHNNWIVSGAGKVYRFKESGLWENDRNGYYSDSTNKYISFGLPGDYGVKETRSTETKALQYALILGAILNRIVILPKFHCYGCKYNGACKKTGARCTFGTFYKMEAFDSQMIGKYRESVFLSHDKVPKTVTDSSSASYFIDTTLNRAKFPTLPVDIKTLTPKDPNGATIEEVLQWFGNSTDANLNFHSLYHGINYDQTHPKVPDILNRFKKAFVESDYRQYKG